MHTMSHRTLDDQVFQNTCLAEGSIWQVLNVTKISLLHVFVIREIKTLFQLSSDVNQVPNNIIAVVLVC